MLQCLEGEVVTPKTLFDFCDLTCAHAAVPKETGIDGSGSCRTFVALYCKRKKGLVHKNQPCSKKKAKSGKSEKA